MKRLLLSPLLISIYLLCSGFLFKNSDVKKLFCKGSRDLSLIVNKKTGQLYIYKINKLFEDKPSNILIPFNGRYETRNYLLKGSSGINNGLFRAELTREYFGYPDKQQNVFYEVNFNDMTGKQRTYSYYAKPPGEVTFYRKCVFNNLDKGLKIQN